MLKEPTFFGLAVKESIKENYQFGASQRKTPKWSQNRAEKPKGQPRGIEPFREKHKYKRKECSFFPAFGGEGVRVVSPKGMSESDSRPGFAF